MKQEFKILEGARIADFKRKSDLIMLDFICNDGKHISLHSLCSLRVFLNDKLLISSWDITKKGKKAKQRFDWEQPFTSMFDDELEASKDMIFAIPVKSVVLNNEDLYIDLENGVKFEFLIDTVAKEEKYRISIMS